MATDPEAGPLPYSPVRKSRLIVMATWDDAPHLTTEQKTRLHASIPPWQKDAREKGIPALGSGKIFPIPESDIKVQPFEIPKHWPRGYGMDVGWNRTAGIWRADDLESGITYLYSEHYRGEAEPTVHADAFRARGVWVPGKIDPAAHGRNQEDGSKLFQIYSDLGLKVENAANAREAGLVEVWNRLSGGRLKVFASCVNWFAEYRLFRRDEKGNIVDEHKFHLMAATRYAILSDQDGYWLKVKPDSDKVQSTITLDAGTAGLSWMR